MKIAISFSGGKTSAVMTRLVLEKYAGSHEIVVTFANTGCEHPATLDFVNNCDKVFGFGTVWLEAVVTYEGRVGIRHKQVTYETASRNGEPFEAVIKKYGIPNKGSPQCTSRLKTEVMESYLSTVGFTRRPLPNYETLIGIRADEADRCSIRANEYCFKYPLVDAGWTREDVERFVSTWPFQLRLPGDHYGNCVWCWKKSMRKLMTLAKDDPTIFDFPARMEREYSEVKAKDRRRVFFRQHMSAEDVVLAALTTDFAPYTRPLSAWDDAAYCESMDTGSGCGESCEIGADV